MLHALITQREGHNMYGKYTDVLEAAYVEFYESLGIRLRPVSNFTKNFDEIVDEQFDLLIVTGGGTLLRDIMWSRTMQSCSRTVMR